MPLKDLVKIQNSSTGIRHFGKKRYPLGRIAPVPLTKLALPRSLFRTTLLQLVQPFDQRRPDFFAHLL